MAQSSTQHCAEHLSETEERNSDSNQNSLRKISGSFVEISLGGPPALPNSQYDDIQMVYKLDNAEAPNSTSGAENSQVQPGCKKYLGLGLALAASLAFSITMLIVKVLSDFHPSTIAVWRFTGVLVPSLPLLLYFRYGKKEPVFDPIYPPIYSDKMFMANAILLRGIFGASAIILQYYSITYMELADSTVIAFSTPVFVSIVARLFLGEDCGIVPIFTALLALGGVVIIARPPLLTGKQEFDEDNLTGTLLAFISMAFATGAFVVLRYLREVHFALVTTGFGIIGIVECGIVCFYVSRFDLPHSPWEWCLGLSLCILTFVGQSLITIAFKYEQAGPISLMRTFDIVFAFIWQFIFLGVNPDIFSLVGSAIVIFGVVLTGVRKGLSTLPTDHPNRMKFWFLLK